MAENFNHASVRLSYGGEDVTRTFIRLLLRISFPYKEVDLNRMYDFLLVDDLKKRLCTFNDIDVAPQTIDFYLRKPDENTLKYTIKSYSEALHATAIFQSPTMLGKPPINPHYHSLFNFAAIGADSEFDELHSAAQSSLLSAFASQAMLSSGLDPSKRDLLNSDTISRNEYLPQIGSPSSTPLEMPESERNSPTLDEAEGLPQLLAPNELQEQASRSNLIPLDVNLFCPVLNAITESIKQASTGNEERNKRLWQSILLTGGGGLISGFAHNLENGFGVYSEIF